MARQRGVFKASGRLDDFNFSIGPDGPSIAYTRFIDKERILKDPNYARTRENMVAFAGSVAVGKAIRRNLFKSIAGFTDRKAHVRLAKIVRTIMNLGPGDRYKQDFEVMSNGVHFQQFEMNLTETLDQAFHPDYSVTPNGARNAATLDVPDFNASIGVRGPRGATHFRLIFIVSAVTDYVYDPSINKYSSVNPDLVKEVDMVTSVEYPVHGMTGSTITLTATLPSAPAMPLTSGLLVAVGIEFFHLVNGVYWPLQGGNAMRIEDVF